MIWLEFSIISLCVIFFGYLLTKKADKLSDAKNIGKGLIGFVLLGFSTSIPELVSTTASTVAFNNPLLGAGNIIGSNNVNLFILSLSLITASTMRKSDKSIDGESIVSMAFCFLITSVFLIAIVFSGKPLVFNDYNTSIYCFLIAIIFIFSIFELHKINAKDDDAKNPQTTKLSPLFYASLVFFLFALVAASYWLGSVVDRISKETGFGATESGAIFLACSTSLPELAVTISAVIIGRSEMGIGNILGSNVFNMFVLALAQFVSRASSSVFMFDNTLVFLAILQMLLLSLLLLPMVQKKLQKVWKISVIPLLLMFLYLGGMAVIF